MGSSTTFAPSRLVPRLLAPALAAGAAATTVAAGWRGTDLAAQVFRADLFRRHGFVLWNGQWFGGHATLNYSVLTPMLSALAGPVPVAAVSGVAAAVLFDRVTSRQFGALSRAGSLWFALGTAANVVIGRVPFALGLAFGLAAVLALQRGRVGMAAGGALLTALSSPVSGVFLFVAVAAWAVTARARWLPGAAIAVAVLGPVVAMTLLFPDSGVFPYEPWAFALDLFLAAAFVSVAGRVHPALRFGGLLYGLVAVVTFVMPSALGGNLSRFSQFFAGPVLACVLWPRRKAAVALLALPLLCWQWVPAVQTMAAGPHAGGTSKSYYEPLIDYVLGQGPVPGRIEVPVTAGHWESAYVAEKVPLARGWERQLDLTYDRIFYDGSLGTSSYEHWLTDNAVQFVALPDAPLDGSSTAERALLESGLPYLVPVWSNEHWQLWRFAGYQGLVDGAATVIHEDPTGFTLRVDAPGDVTLRARPSARWKLDGPGCAASSGDGWTRLKGLRVGTLHLTQQWQGSPCSNHSPT